MNSINGNEQIKGKPFGVVIISVITAVLAGIHFFIAPSLVSKIVGLVAFAAIYGFWTYQIWGYKLIIFVYILQIIAFAHLGYYDPDSHRYSVQGLFSGLFIGILIAGAIIFYLFTAKIKSIFYKK